MKTLKEIQEKIRQISKPNGNLSDGQIEYNQAGLGWLRWVSELGECPNEVKIQYPNDPDHRIYLYPCDLWKGHNGGHVYHDLTKKDMKYVVGRNAHT